MPPTWTMDGVIHACAALIHLRHRKPEQCEIMSQLTDQLQERNKDLKELERKLGDLKNQVGQLEGHLE